MHNLDRLYERAHHLEGEGIGYYSTGEHARALRAIGEAQQIFHDLWSKKPDDEDLTYRFASATNNRGTVLLETGEMESAREAFLQAANLFGQLWKANPDSVSYGNDFAAALNNLGYLLSFTDKPENAVKFLVESLRIRDEVRSRFPSNAQTQGGLHRTTKLLGELYQKLGKGDKAAEMFARAGRLVETPSPSPPIAGPKTGQNSIELQSDGSHWVAYRGDDTNREIQVFSSPTPDRLRALLSEAARHQNGEVSEIFEAEGEEEARRMAPYEFPSSGAFGEV